MTGLMAGGNASEMSKALPRRRRSARAIENDRQIRNAAVNIIAEQGWDAAGFTQVAAVAGLTVGAVYGRYESRTDLGIDVWIEQVKPLLSELLPSTVAAVEAEDPVELEKLLKRWLKPSPELRACLELTIAARFDDDLAEQIYPDCRETMSRALAQMGRNAGHRRQLAAELLGWGLMAAYGSSRPNLKTAMATLLATEHSKDRKSARPIELEWRMHPDSGDLHSDTLEATVLDVIGTVGYGRATLARICRRAGVTSGSVFVRYESKNELIANAVRHLVGDVRQSLAESGPKAMAPAFLHEEHTHIRGLLLELVRVSGRVPELAEFRLADQGMAWLCGLALLESYADGE